MSKQRDESILNNKALRDFLKSDPAKVAEDITRQFLRTNPSEKRHQERVERALEDGARPKRGRFRL